MLELIDVAIRYQNTQIVKSISLHIGPNSRHAILGASGSGKSSLLRCVLIARQEGSYPQSWNLPMHDGKIRVEAGVRVGYVPQEPSLAPWLTSEGNVRMAYRLTGEELDDQSVAWTEAVIERLQLARFRRYYPQQLSIGTMKRVALARALAYRPSLLLLDEPFTGYDFDIRERAIGLVRDYCQSTATALVLVTHDPYEVACLCEAVTILRTPPAETQSCDRGADGEAEFRNRVLTELRVALKEPR